MKKILLVADEPGWVFEKHCKEIKKRLTDFSVDIAYHRQNIPEIAKKHDLVYVLDPMPMRYPDPNKTIIGLRNEFLYREHPEGPKGLYEKGFPGRCFSIKDRCCIFHVVNQNLMKVFKEIVTDKPLFLARHGIDEEIFNRDKYTKLPNDILIASVAGRDSKNKGFWIAKQGCKEACVRYITAQYGKKKLNKFEMAQFYNTVDVHICMSKSEGLNNPILESGAMGVPVISTRSGAAPEMIEDGVSGFLIERDTDSLKDALIKMKNNELRNSMAEKFHKEIMTNWTWATRIEDFRIMFNYFFE